MTLPVKPKDEDCCGSGCNPCIFDVYEEHLKKYKILSNEDDENVLNINNCVSQTSYSIFILTKIENDSKNTNLYTFKFVKKVNEDENNDNCKLILKPGQYFQLKADEQNSDKYFCKPYTILSTNNINLSFTVLIKLYPDGQMSKYIQNLSINSETLWRGPYGNYEINYALKHIFMIAQGTGIAPFYSIIKKIVDNEDCETFLKLFFCCRSVEDIHLRCELHKLSSYWNFTYDVFLTNCSANFETKHNENINLRRLDIRDIESYCQLKNLDKNFQVLICGSDTFMKQIAEFCIKCGIREKLIYKF